MANLFSRLSPWMGIFLNCHPGRSRRRLIGSIALLCAALMAACGDDDGGFATRPSDGSPSGPKIGCKTETEDSCEYGELADDRDGQTYRTVKIGDQVWMAENLNFKTDSSFCFDNKESSCVKYGRLYKWAAAVGESESECGYEKSCSLPSEDIQGVCPSGWHLPSRAEWETLVTAVGDSLTAGKMLKSTSGWNSRGNSTDAFGFSALPVGDRFNDGNFSGEGYSANFWSSTENDSYYSYSMCFSHNHGKAEVRLLGKYYAMSVRCVKD